MVEKQGDTLICSAVLLSEVLSISERQVTDLAKRDVIIRVSRGCYDLGASVRGYFEFKNKAPKNQHSINDEEVSARKDLAEARKAEAKADQEEVKTDLLLRKVHYAEEVEYVWNDIMGAIRSKALATPIKLVAVCFGSETEEDMEREAKKIMVDMLSDLVEYDPKELNKEPIPEDLEGANSASSDSDE